MSATSAAQALMQLDTEIAVFADVIGNVADRVDQREQILEFIKDRVMNTWTLTLAAQSAEVSEQQVIAAMLYLPEFRIGSVCVCRGQAALLFT